jgi:hypothetical protein
VTGVYRLVTVDPGTVRRGDLATLRRHPRQIVDMFTGPGGSKLLVLEDGHRHPFRRGETLHVYRPAAL